MTHPTTPAANSSGRGGGRGGGAGYDFQDVYVARQLAKLLVGGERDPATEVFWEKKAIDPGDGTARPVTVDDLVVTYRSGRWRYAQLKKTGTWTVRALISEGVAAQLWTQWQHAAEAQRAQIRLRLATGGTITPALGQLAEAARTARTPAELTGSGTPVGAREGAEELAAALSLSVQDARLLAFLKTFEAEAVPSADEVHTWTVQVLEPRFDTRAPELAERLQRIVARGKHAGDEARAQHTRATLIEQLEQEGFSCEELRRRRSVPLRVAGLAAAGLTLAIIATPFAWPAGWHRLADTQAAILPLATWLGSPLQPLQQDLADRRRDRARQLTEELANRLEQTTAIRTLRPDLAEGIASSLAWGGRPCVGTETLEQIRRLTGVEYVLTGSFDPQDKPEALTTCLQRTIDGHQFHDAWRLGSTSMETVGRDLGRHLRFSPASLRAWWSGRADRYTRNPDALSLYVHGLSAFQRFDLPQAMSDLFGATQKDPYFYLAHYAYSQVLQERGRDGTALDEATKALHNFEDRHGRDEREHELLRAQGFAARGEWQQAVDLYRGLWRHDPADSQAALLAVEAQNMAGMSDDVLQLVDQIRKLEKQRGVELPPEIAIRLAIEEAVAAGRAEQAGREKLAAMAALKACPPGQPHLEARARFLVCDALVQENEAHPDASGAPWPEKCAAAKRSFWDAGDLINYGKLLQLEARSLRVSKPHCALTKDRLTVDVFRAAQFERGLIDQLTNFANTLTEPPFRAVQYIEAGERCSEALGKACEDGSLYLAGVLSDCAYIYTMTGNLPLAEVMYTDAGRIAAGQIVGLPKDDHMLAVAEGNLAFVEHALGRQPAAAGLYQDSLTISGRLKESETTLAETQIRYARLLFDLDHAKEAAAIYQDATRQMTAKDLGYLLADMRQVLPAGPNPSGWQRIASQPSPPLQPPPSKPKSTLECLPDPVVPTRPDAGAAIPAGTRPAVVQPLGRTLKSCKKLPLPPVQIPKGGDDS